jgi:putative Holliday junction resolvase
LNVLIAPMFLHLYLNLNMNNENIVEERILAIDFGMKRIGLALTDPLKMFAYPFRTILNDDKTLNELILIINQYNVKKIILGYPLREDGRKSELTKSVEKFAKFIKLRTQTDVVLQDERYTSQLAYSKVLESINKKKKRRDKGLIDKNAASIILQDYLDETTGKQ